MPLTLSVHRVREGLKKDRTACINRIRGLLAEFGLVYGKSPDVLRAVLPDVLEDASNTLTALARWVLQRASGQWREPDKHLRWCDQQIGQHVRSNDAARRAATITGIGPIGASALVATVGDFAQFKNGAQFGAWLGWVPSQNFSGGKGEPQERADSVGGHDQRRALRPRHISVMPRARAMPPVGGLPSPLHRTMAG